MLRIRQTIEIQAPADEVWRTVGRPERIAEFHPQVAAATVDGSLRTCTLADGSEVLERIVDHSVAHRFYTYELANALDSLRHYRACIAVRAHGDHTHVDWDAELEPTRAEDGPLLACGLDEALGAGLECLRSLLARPSLAA
jgi:Polyketide cyclase / dehydrase and lipid transport